MIIKSIFGEFAIRTVGEDVEIDPNWAAANLLTIDLPTIGSVTCHRHLIAQLQQALSSSVPPDDLRSDDCWNPRLIRATGDLSRHAWGIAIDLQTEDAGQLAPAAQR